MNDHVARMLADARRRLHDADLLSQTFRSASDSPALLQVLALEILLKTAQLVALGKYKRSHGYWALWTSLPPSVQSSVLAVAGQRYPGHADLSRLQALLEDWEFAFTRGRYYFERYEGYTLSEQREVGEYWVTLGAPESEAEVRYHPMELSALAHGLIAYIENAP